MLLSYALAFPARNDFSRGLSRTFYDEFALFAETFEAASDYMGIDLIAAAYDEQTTKPEHEMIALLTHCFALYRLLVEHLPQPTCSFGLSQGEFTAITAAGGIRFPEVLTLVYELEKIIIADEQIKDGSMMSVVDFDIGRLETCCRRVDPAGKQVSVAMYLSPKNNTISGQKEAVEAVGKLAKQEGARWTIPIKGGAFHGPLCDQILGKSDPIFEDSIFEGPLFPVYSCVTGNSSKDKAIIKRNLSVQISRPVLLNEIVNGLNDKEIDVVLELGPGCTISGNIRTIDPNVKCYWITDAQLLKHALDLLLD